MTQQLQNASKWVNISNANETVKEKIRFGAIGPSNYQQLLNEVHVAGMDGEKQGGDVGLKFLVLHADVAWRFVTQDQLSPPTLQAHRADEVHVHKRIDDALDRRFQITRERSIQKPLRDICFVVDRKHLLLTGEHHHLRGFAGQP